MTVALARGARDFLPAQMHARQRVASILQGVFERFGFEPLNTPAFERIETLTGKYGDEGEKLMFRILARGKAGQEGKADLALRYDLTVPLARVIAMNQDLRTPFKRWQIAPVWRADRPQRGRFREFVQCDADIVGTESPLADAECLAVVHTALSELGFNNFLIRLNDRRVLRSMARHAGAHNPKDEVAVLIAVDKLDKVGRDGVSAELREAGRTDDDIQALWRVLDVPRGHESTLDALEAILDAEGKVGIATLREVLRHALAMGVSPEALVIDPTLARGLDYYTGPVFETEVLEPKIGSISGGGRYDGLVGMFSGKPVPAVGVSLGFERLLTVMEELGMLTADTTSAQVLVTVFSPDQRDYALRVTTTLRAAGVRAELYLDDRSVKAQLKHANARGYPFVAVAGPSEADSEQVTLKDLRTGTQATVALRDAAAHLLR